MKLGSRFQLVANPRAQCMFAGRAAFCLFASAFAAAQGVPYTPGGTLPGLSSANVLQIVDDQLAGKVESGFPFFSYVDTFHEGSTVDIALNVARQPQLIGVTCRIYVTAHKSASDWHSDPSLVDIRGATQIVTWHNGTLAANTVVVDMGTLSGDDGDHVGRGYDVVIDVDGDQELGFGDVIDGRGEQAGFSVVRDTTLTGPHPVTELIYSGGAFLGQDLFFPSDIASLTELPLVIVSHGNGHDYRWYDHIGKHLASWGAIVVSHQNDTAPGPEAASVTTLANLDYLLANQLSIAGGALASHIDAHHIVLIGHSRGGEGAVRAYRKLKDGLFASPRFAAHDIALIACMAPTTQLTPDVADPGGVPFAIFYGGADTDVSSAPFTINSKPLALFERSHGDKVVYYLHGAGHADFHNGGGQCYCAGPNLIGAAATHAVLRGYLRALVGLYAQGDGAAREFLTRSYAEFHPPGIAANVVIASEYRDADVACPRVIDDFETQPDLATSSSGGTVSYDLVAPFEGDLTDFDGSLVYSPATPMNGMVLGRRDETPHGLIFEWEPGQSRFVEFQVLPSDGDVRDFEALSLRAAQGTRHPETDALDADIDFAVTLRDQRGRSATVRTAAFGTVVRTYGRTGVGVGAGWINEFCTLRIPLAAFAALPSRLDLRKIRAVRLDFGAASGAARGRLGLDDVEFAPRRTP